MKSFYIFLSIVSIFFLSNQNSFAQTTNKEVVHKTIDKMNYEFAIAVLKRIKKGDPKSVIETNQKVNDTTFAKVRALEPNVKANSIKRMFSKEKLSDNVTGYIYEIDYIKLSPKYYPTNDILSAAQSLEKIVDKIITRTKDFGDEQKAFVLKEEEIKVLKERLNKIKNSAIGQLKTEKPVKVEDKKDAIKTEITKTDSVKTDTAKKDSILQTTVKQTQLASSEVIYYKINQEDEKELIGTNETTEGEKSTYKFGLDIKNTDSIQIRIKDNSKLDTAFLGSAISSSLILEGQKNRYIIDLNIAKTQENDYIMWIIFGAIAVSIIAFVMYKQFQKDKPIKVKETKKDVVKKDPLSRDNVTINTVPLTNQNTEDKTQIVQNQIQEEKIRLTAILTNSNLSNEQKFQEAKSKNIITEVANNAEIKELIRIIEELSNKTKVQNIETEPIKDQSNKEDLTTQKVISSSKNTKNYQESLYVSLSDIGENGISSERTKGMSNSIFVIRPYSEGENDAKKADLMLHSDIKDMAFESIFRSIEKLDHLMEHSSFTDTAKKITQEEKGELIKEDNVWKVKKRLKVKFL